MLLRLRLKRLTDRLTDAYIEWREECAALEDAYRRWLAADDDPLEAALAYAAYREGLDREERACIRYGELVRRVNKALPGGPAPKPAFVGSTPRI
jgi:hypothetical protein